MSTNDRASSPFDDLRRMHDRIMSAANYRPPLDEEIAEMLWRISANYHREGSGPGSRFAGRTLEAVQAEAVIRRVREADRHDATPHAAGGDVTGTTTEENL